MREVRRLWQAPATWKSKESMTDDAFLAYTAGFFDADGTVGVYWHSTATATRGGKFVLAAGIAQRRWMAIFDEWQTLWGGSLSLNNRGLWIWRLGNRRAALFLKDILSQLRHKKDQAEVAIKFQERMTRRGPGSKLSDAEFEWQRAVSEALREMKHMSKTAPISLVGKLGARVGQLQLWKEEA